MSAYRFVTLTCDTCGEIWDNGTEFTFAGARASAKLSGWVRSGTTGDHCSTKCRETGVPHSEFEVVS